MKHSPAPWEQFGDEVYAADGTRIAEAVTMVDVPLLTKAPRLLAALSKLVELEDMRLRLRQLHEMGHGTDYADYHRLLPLAWAEARAVLGPNNVIAGANHAAAMGELQRQAQERGEYK